tara:strand:- start:1451 stop:2083 length:633 start_codon:yes stop_codon:yes gene_type:complete
MTTGSNAYILLSGPHLNEVDLTKIKNSIVISCSRTILALNKIDNSNDIYYACGDLSTVNDVLPWVQQLPDEKVYLATATDITNFHGYKVRVMPKRLKDISEISMDMIDQDVMPWSYGTVNDVAFPLCMKLRVKNAFLIGCNHDNQGQFFNSKFKSIGDDIIDGVRDAMSFTFKLYKEFFESNGMKIYNTCMDTKETVFDKMEFEESLEVQ